MESDRAPGALAKVLGDVAAERGAQDRRWGHQDFPDGSGPEFAERADEAKEECAAAAAQGRLTWRHILTEEFFEALAESDPADLEERRSAKAVERGGFSKRLVLRLPT